jgi:hypothetical protein
MRYSLKILRGINYFLFNNRAAIRFTKGSEVGIFVNVFITAEGFNFSSSDEGVMLLSS